MGQLVAVASLPVHTTCNNDARRMLTYWLLLYACYPKAMVWLTVQVSCWATIGEAES